MFLDLQSIPHDMNNFFTNGEKFKKFPEFAILWWRKNQTEMNLKNTRHAGRSCSRDFLKNAPRMENQSYEKSE